MDKLVNLLEQHDDLYNQLQERKMELSEDTFLLDDPLYFKLYQESVRIWNKLKQCR